MLVYLCHKNPKSKSSSQNSQVATSRALEIVLKMEEWFCANVNTCFSLLSYVLISNQMKNDPRSYDRNFCNCVKKPEKNSSHEFFS